MVARPDPPFPDAAVTLRGRNFWHGQRLLPKFATEITHGNLTRVLQRLDVADDQTRACIDLGLGYRSLLNVDTAGIDHLPALPPECRGRQGNDSPLERKTIELRTGRGARRHRAAGGTIGEVAGPRGEGHNIGRVATGAGLGLGARMSLNRKDEHRRRQGRRRLVCHLALPRSLGRCRVLHWPHHNGIDRHLPDCVLVDGHHTKFLSRCNHFSTAGIRRPARMSAPPCHGPSTATILGFTAPVHPAWRSHQ